MSRLTDLVEQVKRNNPQLGKDLEEEIKYMPKQSYGLVFERHMPEDVELPIKKPIKGDRVHILPPRGSDEQGDDTIWTITRTVKNPDGGPRTAYLSRIDENKEEQTTTASVDDLLVVMGSNDILYPGLVETGRVERGEADDPYHTVINAENYQALKLLSHTHRGKIDAIYIDPPYNTGAKDWKYNNDYVGREDTYKHSKWLSFMERRLELAKELLNPQDSVLIVTIDEKEYLRLGMLLEQMFPEARIQMVSSVINPSGSLRDKEFTRVDEYIFFVFVGESQIFNTTNNMLFSPKEAPLDKEVRWTPLNRDGQGWERSSSPSLFYPIYISKSEMKIVGTGESLGSGEPRENHISSDKTLFTAFPMKGEKEARWQVSQSTLMKLLKEGYVFVNRLIPERDTANIRYLTRGGQLKIVSGEYEVTGLRQDGSKIVRTNGFIQQKPFTLWNQKSHSARDFGTFLIGTILGDKRFTFPKSLYAVEDALRFFVKNKPNATVLDFFSGSGTTAHAVMRLNLEDNGKRRSISVTNNEVSADEQKKLSAQGLRPGDPEWEKWGICDYVTKPRIRAAIEGKTPAGDPIKGEYKYNNQFPMADGIPANALFYTLTHESKMMVEGKYAFKNLAPLLWLRAGQVGEVIDEVGEKGWESTETYAVINNLDNSADFVQNLPETVKIVFVTNNNPERFTMLCKQLPDDVEVVNFYQSYIQDMDKIKGAY